MDLLITQNDEWYQDKGMGFTIYNKETMLLLLCDGDPAGVCTKVENPVLEPKNDRPNQYLTIVGIVIMLTPFSFFWDLSLY
jgi:hypothetical protein